MRRKFTYLPLLILFTFCGSSDSDDAIPEEQISTCLPQSATLVLSGLTFEYSDNNRLQSVTYYRSNGSLEKKDSLEYDSQNRVSKVERRTKVAGAPRTYEYVYASDGRLKQITETGEALLGTVFEKEFTYDVEGRLEMAVRRGGNIIGYRYEYNSDNNIDRVFYISPDGFGGSKEVLARELFDYDDTPQFYADSPELVQYFTFLVDRFPSANNYLRQSRSYTDPFTYTSPPSELQYGAEYDDNGYLTKIFDKAFTSSVEIDKVIYDCF